MQEQPNPYKIIAVIAGVAALAFFTGIMVAGFNRSKLLIPEVQGLLWPNPPEVREFSLQDQHGSNFSKERLLGHWSFLFFGFTHCPDICPSTMQVLREVKQKLNDDPVFSNSGQVLFVSVDPERDTAPLLQQYLAYFDRDFIGVRGSEDNLKDLTKPLGILFAKIPSNGGYTMDHSASILLVDPVGRVLGLFSMPHDSAQISKAFKVISNFYVEQQN